MTASNMDMDIRCLAGPPCSLSLLWWRGITALVARTLWRLIKRGLDE